MNQRRISVRAIVLHGPHLLGVQLKPYNGVSATMASSWCLPGGGLDNQEALIPGLERELLEETGVRPVVGALLYIQQFVYNQVDFLEFFFHVTNDEDFMNIDLSKTSHGLREINQIAFIDPAVTPLLPEFLMTENLADRVAGKGPVPVFSYVK